MCLFLILFFWGHHLHNWAPAFQWFASFVFLSLLDCPTLRSIKQGWPYHCPTKHPLQHHERLPITNYPHWSASTSSNLSKICVWHLHQLSLQKLTNWNQIAWYTFQYLAGNFMSRVFIKMILPSYGVAKGFIVLKSSSLKVVFKTYICSLSSTALRLRLIISNTILTFSSTIYEILTSKV